MLSLLLTFAGLLSIIVNGVDFTGCINVGQAGGNKTLDAATDDKITSADGRVRFLATTGTDGGCIETMEVGETVWRVRWCISYPTVSGGTLGDTVVLESNGNLTYYGGGARLWSSNSAISGYNGVTSLCVSDCGNIAVKRNDNGESLYDVGYDVLYTNSAPFAYPNNDPACAPSNTPTTAPTKSPTIITADPTADPTPDPTRSPTDNPTAPTPAPTDDAYLTSTIMGLFIASIVAFV